jgi:precorrin-3B synthase
MNAAAMRRGACPTLAAPMQTGDGLLARLDPVAAGLSPAQLLGLCEAASRRGNGIVEVTTRGSLQIRGLSAASAGQLAAEVDALGIAVRSGVPVETGPLAGLDPDEIADPRPLADAIRAAIAAAGLEGRLGPKVTVLVDGGGAWLDEVKADVRLTALGHGAWRLAVGGDAATQRVVGVAAEDHGPAAVIAVLGEIAALGRQGRTRMVSTEAVMNAVANVEYVAPPSAEGGDVERDFAATSTQRHNSIPLTDGRFAVPAALPFGHTRAETLIELLRAAETLGACEIRPAPTRTLLFLTGSRAAARHARDTARRLGFVVDAADPRARIAACPGSPACASGHIGARALAAEIAAAMPAGLAFDLHVSGCEKRCAKPGHDGVTLLGRTDGVALALGKSDTPLAPVAQEQALSAIRRVAALMAAERQSGEAEAAFLSRIGTARLANIFAGTETPKDPR